MTEAASRRTPALARLLVLLAFALLCTAPTPGDVGGCGQPAELLDAPTFFEEKARIECEGCGDCELETGRCERACTPEPQSLPGDCFALKHDGDVCLRALSHASCSELQTFMADRDPAIPWECNFCPANP